MKIAITGGSTIDLSAELKREFDIHVVPFTLVMGDKEAPDGTVKGEDLFAYTAKTHKLAHTSAVNQAQFVKFFGDLRKEYDAVIHFTISKDMSGAYNNAAIVAKTMDNVYVIDTRSLSTGIALPAIYARKLATAGYNPEEIVKMVEKRIPYIQASFGIEAVDYLYKGGRCSGVAALGANLLKLRPQIIVKDGKMIPGRKFHGKMSKWTAEYVRETLKDFDNPDKETVFITYSSAPEDIVSTIRDTLKKEGFENIYNTKAGGTVACHCGPGTLGVLYFNDGPHKITEKK
ncbi:MAG: DegV family protein [Bacilli bacterium]